MAQNLDTSRKRRADAGVDAQHREDRKTKRGSILARVRAGQIDEAVALIEACPELFQDTRLHRSIALVLLETAQTDAAFVNMFGVGMLTEPEHAEFLLRCYLIEHRIRSRKTIEDATVLRLLACCRRDNKASADEEGSNLLVHLRDVGKDKFSRRVYQAFKAHCDGELHWKSEELLAFDFSAAFAGHRLFVNGTEVTTMLPAIMERQCSQYMPHETLDETIHHMMRYDLDVETTLFDWVTRMALPGRMDWLVSAVWAFGAGMVTEEWTTTLCDFEPITDEQDKWKAVLLAAVDAQCNFSV